MSPKREFDIRRLFQKKQIRLRINTATREVLEDVEDKVVELIREAIIDQSALAGMVPLEMSTLRRKTTDKMLIETEQMINSLHGEIENENGQYILRIKFGEEELDKVKWHEDGTEVMASRPFFTAAYNLKRDEIVSLIKERFKLRK